MRFQPNDHVRHRFGWDGIVVEVDQLINCGHLMLYVLSDIDPAKTGWWRADEFKDHELVS